MVRVSLLKLLERIKKDLKSVIPSPKFELLVEPLNVESMGEEKVVLSLPGERQARWLRKDYWRDLVSAISRALGGTPEVILQVRSAPEAEEAVDSSAPSITNSSDTTPLGRVRLSKIPRPILNPRFTFANFVVGTSNLFSCSAAKAVAERPGQAYNPLYIYSETGLGKTHLLHAIGHRVMELYPTYTVIYTTTEKFTSDFIEKVRSGRMGEFHDQYRCCDVLLVDDIQFLAGKTETQMEFFHTLMVLVDSGKQVVVTSDRPPFELRDVDSRLISRLANGLLADIGEPSFETRLDILRKKVEMEGASLSDEILTIIARNVSSNIRELEGALVRLIAFCNFSNVECSPAIAEKVLAEIFYGQKASKVVSMDDIVKAVCETFRVSREVLLSRDRRKKVAEARMMAMYLAREHTNLTLSQIGEELGGRDHSTVSHGIFKTQKLLDEDPYIKQAYQMVLRRLG